jgi:adenylate cyclase
LAPTPFRAGAATAVACAVLYITGDQVFQQGLRTIDQRITDWMFRARGPVPDTGSVVIVDIDERSLAEVGQWPWSRNIVAEMLRRIGEHEPLIIGFDMFFPEPDRSSPGNYLDLLGSDAETVAGLSPAELDYDLALGQAVAEVPVVLGYMFVLEPDGITPGDDVPFPMSSIDRIVPDGVSLELFSAHRPLLNLPTISFEARSEGFINAIPTDSATIRRVPLLMAYQDTPYPSLALEMLREGVGETKITIVADRSGITGVLLGERLIPTDYRAQVTPNWRGGAFTFPYVSACDVIAGRVPPGSLAGRYVLVGSSAQGLHDLRSSPMSASIPGVEIHANVIDSVLRGDVLYEAPITEIGTVFCFLLLGGVGLSALLAFAPPLLGGALGLLTLLGIVYGNYHYFFLRGTLLGITYPLVAVVLVLMVTSLWNYFTAGREKAFIRRAFSHYVSPAVVSQLVRQPEKLSLEGEERELSVMFSDIRDFTSISEGMSAAELSAFLNEYLTRMTDVVMEARGTVDKFIGDAIMAIWGAPLADDQHAVHAVRGSLGMIAALQAMQDGFRRRGLPEIRIGIGVNTGPVSVGNMGSRDRFDYTVMGDNVNLASRLEGLNKVYGTHMLISEPTRLAVGDLFFCRLVDRVRVKGRHLPIGIYEPLIEGTPAPELATETEVFERALEHCFSRRFHEAAADLTDLVEQYADPVYALHLERVRAYIEQPPAPDWDGVFTHTTK